MLPSTDESYNYNSSKVSLTRAPGYSDYAFFKFSYNVSDRREYLIPEIAYPVISLDRAELEEDAKEHEFTPFTDSAISCTEYVLEKIQSFKIHPSEVSIYPMPDGEIAIDIYRGPVGKRQSILFLCQPDDTIRCLNYINEEERIPRHDFPTSFVHKAFESFKKI